MQLLKYLTVSLLISLGTNSHLLAGEVYDNIVAERLIKVATDANWPPQSFLNEDNKMEGFDADVAREIARRMGVEIEFVTPSWDHIVIGDWNRRWDLHVGSMTATRERARKLVFPAVYYFTPASVAVHEDSNFSAISQLNGKRIGTGASTTYERYLQKNLVIDSDAAPAFSYQIDNPEIKSYETSLLALDELRLEPGQKLDAVIGAMPVIMQSIGEGYPIKLIGEPIFYEPLAVAIDIGDQALAQKLEDIIGWMHKDGTLSKISKKWYGVDYAIAE